MAEAVLKQLEGALETKGPELCAKVKARGPCLRGLVSRPTGAAQPTVPVSQLPCSP